MLLLVVFSRSLWAAEGFWLKAQLDADSAVLHQVSKPQRPAIMALPLQQAMAATARIGQCSGAFISASGLFITSAHCIAQYLPKQNGAFAAGVRQHEIPLPALQLDLLQQREDVTVAVHRQLSTATSAQSRAAKLEAVRQQLLADCQQQSSMHCELSALHGGLEFYLQRYLSLRDVRLVYHPASQDGANAPNWPRYSADYVLLRAYVGPNNAAQGYADDNQPYRGAFVRLSAKGVAEHDVLLSPGFSGNSRRHASVDEVQFYFEQFYPKARGYLQQGVSLIEQLAPAGTEQSVQYRATVAQLKQQAHQFDTMLQHYQYSSLLADKQAYQQALLTWINASPLRQQLYGPVLKKLQLLLQKQQAMQQRDLVLNYLQYAQLPYFALQLYQLAQAPDSAQQAKIARLLRALDAHYDSRIDMELAVHFLGQYAKLPVALRLPVLDQYFALNDGFNREIVRHKLAAMYRGTALTGSVARTQWLARPAQDFVNSSDPMINFAVAMFDTAQQLANERAAQQLELAVARSAMMEVQIAFNDARGVATYADTNGQLRFSVGYVSGYQPMDAVWYQPFSSLAGMLHKQYNAKQPEGIALASSVAKTIPVNFLSDVDSCSAYGSAPTLNAAGELVGVMYAGVQENLLADWHYDDRESRSVHIDSRFIIWQLQQTQPGQALLQELLQ